MLATFQSTLPARGATKSRKEHGMAQEFQSTLPARGATRWFGRSPKQNSISIHAPRTGSDSYSNFAYARCKNFNPRSPHGERRFRPEPVAPTQDISIHAPRTGSDENKRKRRTAGKFQSTLPARGATPSTAQWRQASRNFNPRSPHGERRLRGHSFLFARLISIHAPRTGSDPRKIITSYTQRDFNPRSPHGERLLIASSGWATPHFNPRSPHGERRYTPIMMLCSKPFQSTLPARGATHPSLQ